MYEPISVYGIPHNSCPYINPQTAKILSSHKGPTWASEAHLPFNNLYEIYIINFYPYSFVLIISILVVVKINIISNIHLIVTNIHMYIYL